MSRSTTARFLLAAGVLFLVLAGVAPRPATAAPVTGGALDWGIRASFRNYIVGPIAQGTIAPGAPATVNGDGSFHFPATSGDATSGGSIDVAFGGAVHFRGHGYHDPAAGDLLQVSVSGIRIQGTTLIADVTSLPLPDDLANPGPAGAVQTYDDVVFATLATGSVTPEASGSGFVLRNVPVTITAAGAEAFAGFYVAGETLDPLTLALTTGGGGGATTSTTPTTPTTARPNLTTPTTATPGRGANVGVTVGGSTAAPGPTTGVDPATGLAYTGWSVGAAVAGLALLGGGIAFLATADAAHRLRRVRPARVGVSDGCGGGAGRRR